MPGRPDDIYRPTLAEVAGALGLISLMVAALRISPLVDRLLMEALWR